MEELWQEIWQTISRNKWRSLMTAFGVFWGLLMLILLLGFGASITGGLMEGIKSVPSNTLFVLGHPNPQSPIPNPQSPKIFIFY